MWIPNFLKSRSSTSPGRRPTRRPAARLCLEPLEERCLLSFSPAVSYAAGTNPQGAVTADFNGDGRLDLAVANYNSNTVSVLLGNANGTFQPALTSGTGAGPQSLLVGDFNSDGKLDLATVNSGDVSMLLGNGNGIFQAPRTVGVPENPNSVAAGDFNGDGKLDLAVTSNNYYPDEYGNNYVTPVANVLLGNGTGSFGAPQVFWSGGGDWYFIYRMATTAADFNGDGKQDLATGIIGSGSVMVFLGSVTGPFGAPTYFNAGAGQTIMAAADVSGDGTADLVTAGGAQVGVLPGTGLGTFGTPQYSSVGSAAGSVAVADFNADGNADLIAAGAGVLLGTGSGAFKPTMGAGAGLGSFAVGDFNGDGRPDAASAYDSNVSVLLNDGIWLALDAPSITISDVTVSEGNIGPVNATFIVSLSAASSQTVSVHYATADYAATLAGGDYQAKSGTLTFAPGVNTSQTVTVLVNGDRLAESSETFLLLLTDPTNAFVADGKGVGTIVDDEPSISIEPNVSGVEGNTGTTAFTFNVTLSALYDVPVTVDYATADDDWYGVTATAGVDYTPASGTVTFAPGETSMPITVQVAGDRIWEGDEDFVVNLSNANYASIDNSQALGVITDDEPLVGIGGSPSFSEGNSGTKAFTFVVSLSVPYDLPVTVSYATADASALAGSDYVSASGTLTFAPGQTNLPIAVMVIGDSVFESGIERFNIYLTGATNAAISQSWDYGTIWDDDVPLTISISDVTKTEGKKGQTTLFTFTVTLSAACDQPVTMSYTTVNGTAKSGEDYVARTGTLTFAPGETTKTITIEVKGDTKKEADETFYLDLFGNSSNSLFTKNRGIGTILNDD
jgi:hypothetical protein